MKPSLPLPLPMPLSVPKPLPLPIPKPLPLPIPKSLTKPILKLPEKNASPIKPSTTALANIPGKGRGLVAKEYIRKGDVIAYYRAKVYDRRTYESPTDGIYLFTVYKKNEDEYKNLVADIFNTSVLPPKDGITYLALYSNEPAPGQKSNADIDLNFKGNYNDMGRSKLKPGDIIVYKLIAMRDIEPGEEIVWYYGADYPRTYELGDVDV